MPSEAMKKAIKKYNQKFDHISFKAPKGKRDIINKFVADSKKDDSLNGFINRAIDETMERDSHL